MAQENFGADLCLDGVDVWGSAGVGDGLDSAELVATVRACDVMAKALKRRVEFYRPSKTAVKVFPVHVALPDLDPMISQGCPILVRDAALLHHNLAADLLNLPDDFDEVIVKICAARGGRWIKWAFRGAWCQVFGERGVRHGRQA